jgi:hypothetical protein
MRIPLRNLPTAIRKALDIAKDLDCSIRYYGNGGLYDIFRPARGKGRTIAKFIKQPERTKGKDGN